MFDLLIRVIVAAARSGDPPSNSSFVMIVVVFGDLGVFDFISTSMTSANARESNITGLAAGDHPFARED